MDNIKGKDLRYTIKAVIDIPADEPESIEDYLESLREVGAASVVSVEVVEPGAPLPDIMVRKENK